MEQQVLLGLKVLLDQQVQSVLKDLQVVLVRWVPLVFQGQVVVPEDLALLVQQVLSEAVGQLDQPVGLEPREVLVRLVLKETLVPLDPLAALVQAESLVPQVLLGPLEPQVHLVQLDFLAPKVLLARQGHPE